MRMPVYCRIAGDDAINRLKTMDGRRPKDTCSSGELGVRAAWPNRARFLPLRNDSAKSRRAPAGNVFGLRRECLQYRTGVRILSGLFARSADMAKALFEGRIPKRLAGRRFPSHPPAAAFSRR